MEFKYKELLEEASKPFFDLTIKEWFKSGYLEKVLPEIYELSKYIHNVEHHPEGNPLEHTISALRIAEYMEATPIVKIAVLFHDIGKGVTAGNYDKEIHPYHNFYKHDFEGLKVFKKVAERLEIPETDKETILYCIKYHMKVHKFLEIKKISKIAEIVLNKDWYILKDVVYCDCASRLYKFDAKKYWEYIKVGDSLIFDDFSSYGIKDYKED